MNRTGRGDLPFEWPDHLKIRTLRVIICTFATPIKVFYIQYFVRLRSELPRILYLQNSICYKKMSETTDYSSHGS